MIRIVTLNSFKKKRNEVFEAKLIDRQQTFLTIKAYVYK